MLKFGSSSRSFVSRNRVSFLSFIALVGFIGSSFFAFSTHSQSNEKAVSAKGIEAAIPVTSPSPTPTPHDLVGSFYTLQNGTNAKLMLNNKGSVPLEVSPTLYNSAGQALELAPVTVEAHSALFINLSDWAAVGGESFQTGSIKLFHVGKDLVLGAQIYLENEANSLSYEEKLAELGKFDSRRQEAVWLQPTRQTTTKIVLSNTSDAPLTVTGRLAKAPRLTGAVNTFQLAAHETRLLDLRTDFTDGSNFAETELVGLSFEHAGANDALQTRAMVADVGRGYSNVVQFSNPAGGKSSEYQAVGFQIEKINNEQFLPIIVARNVGNGTATVAAKVPYTRTNGTLNIVTLPPTILRAGEIKLLDTRRLLQKAQQEQIKIASLEITYNTAPGSVIVAAQSVGANGSLVLRPPMWDPFAQRSPTGGYPWRIEETSTTKTYIKNITDREQSYVAYLFWENGGNYMIGRQKVAPHQTVEIDVKDLRDRQVADEFGRTIPLYMTNGQLHWTLRGQSNPQLPSSEKARENLALLGRTEQIDLVKGISSNYACQNCCQATAYGDIFPNNIGGEAGSQIQFIATEYGTDCYGTYYTDVLAPGEADWSSSDNDVATVNSYGLATLIGAGNVDIEAEWEVKRTSDQGGYCPGPFFTSPPLFDEPSVDEKKVSEKDTLGKEDSDEPTPNRPDCNVCSAYFEEENVEGDLQVRPRIDSLSPARDVVGNTTEVTITGAGFRSGATVAAGAGISVSNVTVNSATEITANFAIAANASGGDRAVSVTVRGLTSATKNFFVQIPTKLRRDDFTTIVIREPTPGNFVNIFGETIRTNVCGAYRNLKYTLLDQAGNAILQELTVTETLTDFMPSDPNLPPPQPNETATNDEGIFGDTIGVPYAPPCNIPPFNYTLKQGFKVTVGESTYNLTTNNGVSVAKTAPAQWTINVTITTP